MKGSESRLQRSPELDPEFSQIMGIKSMTRPQSKYNNRMGGNKQAFRGPSIDAEDPESSKYQLRSAMSKAGREIANTAGGSMCNSSRASEFNTERHDIADGPSKGQTMRNK